MGTKLNHQRKSGMFSQCSSLAFIGVDILSQLPRTKSGNQFVATITDRYSKLALVLLTTSIVSNHVACIVLNHFVTSYRITVIILFDNGRRFVRNVFIS